MATVQPISTLNIDNVAFDVADLSQAVQSLVGVYNEWNQDFADAQKKAAQLQAALNEVSRQIIAQVKADQDAAEKAVAEVAVANDSAADPASSDTETAKE